MSASCRTNHGESRFPPIRGDKGISFSAKGKQQEKKKRLPQHAGRFFPTSRDNLNNAAPAFNKRDAIIEAGQRITLCRPVSRIIHIVAAYAQPGIAVQAYKFQAAGLPISGLIDFQISPDFFTGLRLRLFRSTEKPIGNAPPYFSQSHGVVIVFGRSHV